jgi:branched-chain amino acid transport system permease protein
VRLNDKRIWLPALVLVAIVSAPHIFYSGFLMKALCLALFACAFNLLLGYAGMMSFGHAAFFGAGAYLGAYLLKTAQLEPFTALMLAAGGATVLGVLFGLIAIKRTGISFAMVTLALGQLFYFLALQPPLNNVTRGEDGVQDVPRGHLFGLIDLSDSLTMYYLTAIVVVLGILAIRRIINSPFGEVLLAIRENEQRAISLGFHTIRYKFVAFVLSAFFSGLAGALKALVFQFAVLPDLSWHTSGEVVLITLLGGIGTVLGPVIGAFLLTMIEGHVAEINVPAPVVVGFFFVACVLLFRRGLYGEYLHRRRARENE